VYAVARVQKRSAECLGGVVTRRRHDLREAQSFDGNNEDQVADANLQALALCVRLPDLAVGLRSPERRVDCALEQRLGDVGGPCGELVEDKEEEVEECLLLAELERRPARVSSAP
jgi:hypothetical protein